MQPNLIQQTFLSLSLPYLETRKPARANGFLRECVRVMNRAWKRRRMIAELDKLDDHILRDIGIHRGGISSFVDRFDDRELCMKPVATPTGQNRI